jgi:hypothetical protein
MLEHCAFPRILRDHYTAFALQPNCQVSGYLCDAIPLRHKSRRTQIELVNAPLHYDRRLDGGNVVSRLRVFCVLVSAAVGLPCKTFALDMPLPRGGETIFAISIVNPTTNNAASVAFESIPIVSSIPGVYVLETLSSPTCEIQNGVLGTGATVVLSVASVPARSTVNCSLKMRRSQMSDFPVGLEFKPSTSSPADISLSDTDWTFGPVLDLSLRIKQILPFPNVGERTGFVRVMVHNPGPWYIDEVGFGYCQDAVLAPFTLDNALPDGCADASDGPTCWDMGAFSPVQHNGTFAGRNKILRPSSDCRPGSD